jgi:hypothetical protein
MFDSRAMIMTDEGRNGLAAGALAVIGSAFPVGWLFAESATRADPGVVMGTAMLVWFGSSIIGGMVVRLILNILWRPRPAYFSEFPISTKSYLVGALTLTAVSLYCGHSYYLYEKKQIGLARQQQEIAQSKLETKFKKEKAAKDEESLKQLMSMTFAEKVKAARDSIANIPLGTTYEELVARVPSLYCEQPPNPRIKICHGRFNKEVFNYALMDGKVYNNNGRTSEPARE